MASSPGSKNPRQTANQSASAYPDEGMPIQRVRALKLSTSVRRALDRGQALAVEQRFRGLFGTGLLLMVLEEAGRSASDNVGVSAARWLFERIQAAGGDRFAAARRQFFAENALPEGAEAAAPQSVSQSLWGVFQAAARLPAHDGILATRHLLVALLAFQPTGRSKPTNAHEVLGRLGLDRQQLLAELLQSLATGGPTPERADWRALAGQSPAADAATAPEVAAGPVVAGFAHDTPSGRAADDCLDLGSTIAAMANLIASPQLDGTLSLGVFGNWGSGKSFFMCRLREAIHEITAGARRTAAPASGLDYWPNIAQVEFNAWHYVDASLWASLMSHLLDVLRRWNPPGEPADHQSQLAAAIEKLEITATARNEAVARQAAAEAAQEEAEAKRQVAQNRYSDAAERLQQAMQRSLWSFVEKTLGGSADPALRALRELGLLAGDAQLSVEALYAETREFTTTAGRLRVVADQMLRQPEGAKALRRFAYAAAGTLGAILVVSIWVEWFRNAVAVLGAAVVGAVAFVAKVWELVQRVSAGVAAKLAPLRTARLTIEQQLADAEAAKAGLVAGIEKEVAECSARLAAATAEVTAREQDVRAAERAVKDAVSGRAVQQFIEQRLAAGDYQKQLGLIATIRRDFEQLSDLIRAHNAMRLRLPQETAAIETALRRARPDITKEELTALYENLGINRIVLYIDDLDRCPPDRVVEVLQAIHLLLSFPIFVVVVGVDSRWMAHSLAREYPSLLGGKDLDDGPSEGRAQEVGLSTVTPADYLEKIFQIPFWVPPLDPAATAKMIGRLVGAGDSPTAPREGHATNGDRAQPQSAPANQLEPMDANAAPATPDTGNVGAGASPLAGDPAPVALRPDLLQIGAEEQQAMQSLAAIVGRSPRATKRFVNSYRLLKVALVDDRKNGVSYSEAAAGALAAPMFLLAIVTGLPGLAAKFVEILPANQTASAVDQLLAVADWAAADVAHADAVRRTRLFHQQGAERWQQLAGLDLLAWVTRVAQFSFHSLASAGVAGAGNGGSEVHRTAE